MIRFRMFSGKLKNLICLSALISVLSLTGCGLGGPDREYVAVVDGDKIYLDEFDARLKAKLNFLRKNASYGEAQIGKLREEVVNDSIDEMLMLKRAKKIHLKVEDKELQKKIDEIKSDYTGESFSRLFKTEKEFQMWREDLRKRLILENLIGREVNAGVTVSDDEARSYYKSHSTERTAAESVHLFQIVVSDRKSGEEALRRLDNGEDFSKVAGDVSTGPEASRGGDLGFFSRGVLPEYFDRVIFSIPSGKHSGIVETPYGFHIFKVIEKVPKKSADFESAKLNIKDRLKREKEEKEYERWLKNLRSGAVITINQAVLEKAGLQ
jgi:parvulin-like peptidyl-prolyl isomerase